ncbi:MAG: 30S ribosomal protein S11 [Candidatus Yonathbacteria bacterium CG_4_10_14_3_um_filter_47_65]|uniref:Small ribosomal subunit protein uS11 n=2 Tax=Parcubacteria group TaxID=1794811 RepID=A0A2M8D5F0_9BACT|nr:MAG: 30S ribosomal protein S11 [Candidatus Nomurabacteria bacterium CG1_02_47_685]PIP03809.1 MAG: 30S ribosomal protein S11 [Candidatus Yonathbacteria bacterium CG23_combo_of_CG06-09_8_20_14_all_46_18]PIQ32527.1 MAG: 30S ribosomal protein S11 [Candidatus Yonathbacteria bacterium CG17_big_fil_post_rev_8_21_14_2_50_46_19]PIX56423.1 MAG: 30S ribosomal protein S11 [Candidatus Yonathbacteria bacterium CG_4_10_14_3_um_filter_47_65]PIY57968.1 MAG: 30S ribosomal protein S11 [Candidatus Yonathbacteri
MGKKRIVKKAGGGVDQGKVSRSLSRTVRKSVGKGTLYVRATYNNTRLLLADKDGGTLAWSSSGALGFKGAKKGTPFAAAKVGELLAEKAGIMGVKEVAVIVKGVGPGRESSIRAFVSRGVDLLSIQDKTPVPHNGPRAKKPRRV